LIAASVDRAVRLVSHNLPPAPRACANYLPPGHAYRLRFRHLFEIKIEKI
jgi:hypothetical protein